MSSVSTRTVDHIVIRVADGGLAEATKEFEGLGFQYVRYTLCKRTELTNGYRVIPGGKHTDGLTANVLIVSS